MNAYQLVMSFFRPLDASQRLGLYFTADFLFLPDTESLRLPSGPREKCRPAPEKKQSIFKVYNSCDLHDDVEARRYIKICSSLIEVRLLF